MTVSEAIKARRSVRRFKQGEDVTNEQINILLEAAMIAPSACNSRPWEYVVVKNREVLDAMKEIHENAKMLRTASIAIIVCAMPELQSGLSEGYFPQDCGAATQNILLQAVELGLGACWCGVYPREERVKEFQRILGVSSIPFNVIAIGVPDQEPEARGFFDESRVKYIN